MPAISSFSIKDFGRTFGLALFIWTIMVAAQLFKWFPKLVSGELPGNDDYMRIVQIRDWMNGQAWLDLTQNRLYPPDPLNAHWARLTDILFAAISVPLTPLLGAERAELAALILLPSLLCLIMIILVIKIAQTLTDNPWIGLTSGMMSALCVPISSQFSPGRIDHHGLQIVLALMAALALIKSDQRPRLIIITAICCALGLWVGVESAPFIASACVAIGLIWVFDEPQSLERLRLFAVSFFGAVLALFLTSRPSQLWSQASCDAISPVFIVLCALIAAAFLICSFAPLKTPLSRFGLIAALGTCALVSTIAVYPHCMAGPYAELDPRLADVWLANVSEAKGFLTYIHTNFVDFTSRVTIPVMALIMLGWVAKKEGILKGIIATPHIRSITIFMLISLLISLVQIRSLMVAAAFACPLAAWMMANALQWSECVKNDIKRAFLRSAILIGLSPLMAPLIVMIISNQLTPASQTPASQSHKPEAALNNISAQNEVKCRSSAAISALATLPDGFAITPIELGAPILAMIDNLSVSSAPYHRNEAGNLAALDVFMGSTENAKARAIALGADYLIACQDNAETSIMTNYAPDGLLAQLTQGAAMDWLAPIDIGPNNPILVYKITP